MKRFAVVPLVTAAVLGLSSCAQSTRQEGASEVEPAGPTVVRINNNNTLDVNVFLVPDGERIRLGMVTAGNTQNFEIPETTVRRVQDLRIVVDPVGTTETFSSSVLLSPGQELDVNVAPVLQQSTISVQRS